MDIGHWVAANRLQVNPAKTELHWGGEEQRLVVGPPRPDLAVSARLRYCDSCSGSYHFVGFEPRRSARRASTNYTSTTPHQDSWKRIRKSLDNESGATLVHSCVTSRIDYCNAVYAMSSQTITRFWRSLHLSDSSLISLILRTTAHCSQPTVNCTQRRLLLSRQSMKC